MTTMQLRDVARRLPADIWALFEPILPPVVYSGTGRRPATNRACLHGILFVLVTGIGWDLVPLGFPCGKTLKKRLRLWLRQECFLLAWEHMAHQYEQLR